MTSAMKEAGAAVLRAAGVDGAYDIAHEVLAQALAARPEPEGMETTAEQRGAARGNSQPTSFERRLLRDFDRLSAESASLKAKLAEAEAEKAETRKILVRCHDRIHALPRTSDTDLAIAIERLLGRLARGGRHER